LTEQRAVSFADRSSSAGPAEVEVERVAVNLRCRKLSVPGLSAQRNVTERSAGIPQGDRGEVFRGRDFRDAVSPPRSFHPFVTPVGLTSRLRALSETAAISAKSLAIGARAIDLDRWIAETIRRRLFAYKPLNSDSIMRTERGKGVYGVSLFYNFSGAAIVGLLPLGN